MSAKDPHNPEPPKPTTGYDPKALAQAPTKAPRPTQLGDADKERVQRIETNHNLFALALMLIGVGVLVVSFLAIVFLPDATLAALTFLWIIGGAALLAGLVFDIIYRKSYVA